VSDEELLAALAVHRWQLQPAAAALQVSRPTLYRLINSGELKAVRVGQRLRFRPEDIEAYLRRDESAAGGEEVNPAPATA
jgi:excisionase family DNA binding protein